MGSRNSGSAAPADGARVRVTTPSWGEWRDGTVLDTVDGVSTLAIDGDVEEIVQVKLESSNCQLLRKSADVGGRGLTVEPPGEHDDPRLLAAPPSNPSLVSPIKMRFGIINETNDPNGLTRMHSSELSARALAQLSKTDEAGLASRVGTDYQASIPAYLGECGTAPSGEPEPELIWAPSFEGVIRDLVREPPRAEIERYDELRRRQQKPCGIPGCLLHDKHPGPHIFPEPTGKRQGKVPWRGSPRCIAPAVQAPKPKAVRRVEASAQQDGAAATLLHSDSPASVRGAPSAARRPTPQDRRAAAAASAASDSEASSGSDAEDSPPQRGGKRLNADRIAAREAQRLARTALQGRKRDRQPLNYRQFGGIVARGERAGDASTHYALAAAKAAKGDPTDRRNVGLARRVVARPLPEEEETGPGSRYERVAVVEAQTGRVLAGKRAPMRMNLAAYLERFPTFEVHEPPERAVASAAPEGRGRGGRGRRGGGRRGGRGGGRWRQAQAQSAITSSSEGEEEGEAGGAAGEGSERASGEAGAASDEERWAHAQAQALAQGGSGVTPEAGDSEDEDELVVEGRPGETGLREMTQDRVNELFTVGSRVCAFFGCGKIYASTDGVRKHAKRCHMGWVLERDREREGVWLEPMPTAANAQVVTGSGSVVTGSGSAHAAKKHGPRGVVHGPIQLRKGSLAGAVPWTLPDRRRRPDRGRLQLWPISRRQWLDLARLSADEWLIAASVDSLALGPGAAASGRAAKRARDAGGDAVGCLPEAQADRKGAPARAGEARRGSAALRWAYDDESRSPRSPSPVSSMDEDSDEEKLPARPSAPVPGARAQPPGLWPDGRPLPPLNRGIPGPMPVRPSGHIASTVAKMTLPEIIQTPMLSSLYFAAAGHSTPQVLQLSTEQPELHQRPDQFVQLVYWRRRAPAARR